MTIIDNKKIQKAYKIQADDMEDVIKNPRGQRLSKNSKFFIVRTTQICLNFTNMWLNYRIVESFSSNFAVKLFRVNVANADIGSVSPCIF